MLEGTIRANVLSEALTAANALVQECKIQTNDEGLYVETIDAATAAAIELDLSADAFESYEAIEGVMGVDVTRFLDILKMVDSDQLVRLAEDEETRSLLIQAGGMEYTLGLIDPSTIRDRPDLDDLHLPAQVVISGGDLDRAVKTAEMVSDHLELGVDEDGEYFYVDAEGDVDEIHFELDEGELVDLTVGPAHSTFSVSYLVSMLKAIPADAAVEIDLGEDMPTELRYEFAEGDGEITYFLAPRLSASNT